MLRLVLDTNVWLDWLVFRDPGLESLRDAHAAGRVEIFIDEACEAELARVLAYDLGKHSIDAASQAACLSVLRKTALPAKTNSQTNLPRCSDPDDQKFLELAAAARADALVTKDAALLDLRRRVPFRILEPADLGLLLAYEMAEYVVFNPQVVFRVGEPSAALDKLLESHGEKVAAYITASNPGSEPRPEAENQAANGRLLESQRLLSRTCLLGEGRAPDGSWAERSFFILGTPRAEAEALGRAFGQNAIVFCEKGRAPELVVLAN
jgi:putative PIN family toxin of toxin-antitoxin system